MSRGVRTRRLPGNGASCEDAGVRGRNARRGPACGCGPSCEDAGVRGRNARPALVVPRFRGGRLRDLNAVIPAQAVEAVNGATFAVRGSATSAPSFPRKRESRFPEARASLPPWLWDQMMFAMAHRKADGQ